MKDSNRIKVLLADDHQVMIDGLRALLQNEKDIEIVAEANTGSQALNAMGKNKIDVIVLDIRMPEMDGFETVSEMCKKYPDVKILILSFHKEEGIIEKMLGEQVPGYIIKDSGSAEIVKAIREVAAGRDYYDKEVQSIITKIIKNKKSLSQNNIKLTEKETNVLFLLAENMSSKEIGEKLFISPSTVETHKKNAAEKLGLRIGQLKKYAIEERYKK